MKKIMQFRYDSPTSQENYPKYENYNLVLANENIFNNYKSITQIGIQAPPGVKFYLNKSSNPITIGKTGIYELDLTGMGFISAIRFSSPELATFIDADNTARLLIDIIYEEGE